jgi:adenylate cyclase
VYLVRRSRAESLRIAQLSELLKRMFGRYISNEVMHVLLADPGAFELGGQRRKVTVMFTDLRGFASFAERLPPEDVLATLNDYFAEMIDVCIRYGGTVTEIMGDALLVTFGPPLERADHAAAATACAIEMQNAMVRVNAHNREAGHPALEMGIGLNTAVVVVGNLGSAQRTTYGVVGSGVNLASRIESYTVGGQVLVSQSLVDEAGPVLRIDGRREVTPKGSESPVTLYDIGGVGGDYNVVLDRTQEPLHPPPVEMRLAYRRVSGKHVTGDRAVADVTGLSATGLEADGLRDVGLLDNVELHLPDASPQLQRIPFYGKVLTRNGAGRHQVRFTGLASSARADF